MPRPTGPFYVEGAEPGDTVAVHFVSIEPARDWAASTTVPLFGALTATHATALLHDPLPEFVWAWRHDRANRSCRFEAHNGSWAVDLPMDPMHGTLGVAPANLEVRSALVPDAFGGNMDTVMVVDLVKGVPCPWPRIESDTHLMTTGSARPLEDAFRIAQVDLVGWLHQDFGLDVLDAYQVVSQAVEAPIANVVDTNYTSVAKIAKRWLPRHHVFEPTHARMRAIAEEYRSRQR